MTRVGLKWLVLFCELRHLDEIIVVGRTSLAGAEGATAPETLRQMDRHDIEDSGERREERTPKG
jgi:hypothetical protein